MTSSMFVPMFSVLLLLSFISYTFAKNENRNNFIGLSKQKSGTKQPVKRMKAGDLNETPVNSKSFKKTALQLNTQRTNKLRKDTPRKQKKVDQKTMQPNDDYRKPEFEPARKQKVHILRNDFEREPSFRPERFPGFLDRNLQDLGLNRPGPLRVQNDEPLDFKEIREMLSVIYPYRQVDAPSMYRRAPKCHLECNEVYNTAKNEVIEDKPKETTLLLRIPMHFPGLHGGVVNSENIEKKRENREKNQHKNEKDSLEKMLNYVLRDDKASDGFSLGFATTYNR